MKLSFNWLREFVKINISPEELAEKLTLAGFEVEKIEKMGEKINNILIGEILEIEKHPHADRLRLVKVKTKEGIKKVVCGADNIKKGQKVPLALAGAVLPNGMIIKKSKIREVISEGMLCAEDELGIGEGHAGIYILNPETKITDDIKKILGLDDVIFNIDITPNRGDCLSVLGLAREVAAMNNSQLTTHNLQLKEENKNFLNSKIEELEVKVKDFKLCPKYTAAVIKGVKVKESPEWIKSRLRNSGIKAINNIVDITNYILLELGQPLHAFDFGKIDANIRINTNNTNNTNKKIIIIRPAKKEEKIITIDDKERELDKEMLVIANAEKPVAVAGVMGGKESEISDKTTEIILESAQFNPASIRRTSKKLGLRSESSIRFERGIDWNITEIALERAIELIKKLAQGKEVKEIIRITKNPIYLRKTIKIKSNFISNLLGVEISKEKIKKIFLSLGLKVGEYNYQADKEKFEIQEQITEEAKKLIGRPYKLGAKENEAPKYFDCSSFVQYLYKKTGIIIPRCSEAQAEIGKEIKRADLQKCDLIFVKGKGNVHYSFNFPQGLDHVALCAGKNKVIYAGKKEGKVVEEKINDFLKERKWVIAKRIIGIEDDYFLAVIPSWREDIKIKEDLVEEIGRIYGYNKMSPTFLKAELRPSVLPKRLALENKIKDSLVAFGFDEVYNYSFYGLKNSENMEKHLRIINPLNPEQEFLRTSLKARIKENLEKNLKFFKKVKVFEIGNIFLPSNKELPEERKKIAVAIAFKENNFPPEKIFRYLKGVLENLMEKISIAAESLDCKKNKKLIEIKISGKKIGDMEINQNSAVFEFDFEKLIELSQEKKIYQKIAHYPSVIRDLAFVLDKNIPYQEVLKTIKRQSPLIQEIELFDIFESEKLGKDKKSLAFHLVFQSREKTLKAEEAEQEIKKILNSLDEEFKAKLRG